MSEPYYPSHNQVTPIFLSTARKPPAPYKVPWCAIYRDDFVELFCTEIAHGRALLRICCEECWAPGASTVYKWLRERQEFRDAYDAACHVRAEDLANEIIALADNSVDHEKTRQQIGARQWLAGKLSLRYGEKKVVEANVNQNVNVQNVTELDVSHLNIEELKALESAFSHTLELQANSDEEESNGA